MTDKSQITFMCCHQWADLKWGKLSTRFQIGDFVVVVMGSNQLVGKPYRKSGNTIPEET